MLTHPTEQRLVALGLGGMAKALAEQRQQPDIAALTFEERLGLLVDREAIERENKWMICEEIFLCATKYHNEIGINQSFLRFASALQRT